MTQVDPNEFKWGWGVLINLPSMKISLVYVLCIWTGLFLCKKFKINYSEQLRFPLSIFNIFVSLGNLVCFYLFAKGILRLQSHSFYANETGPDLQTAFDLFYFLKQVELLDTAFIILRRNYRQLTTLHIYHHASILVLAEAGTITYTAPVSVGCIINCFVHIIMYFYWALVSRSFDVRSWKKQITQLQLLQFFVAFGMLMHGYSLGVYCIYAPLYDLSMIVLFGNFYYRNYILSPPPPREKEKSK
mmetsp:Transcript_25622/g.35536  ORF Transcript_25622/g.35536 Transcript_25622/m.35536 type:complete len:245 (-) Transcript_25622:40-774(-)